MILETRHFGEIDISEQSILRFEKGLPGFEHLKDYAIIGNDEEESPFKWLQSVNESQIAFAMANPFLIVKDYDIELSKEDITELGIEKEEEVAVFVIVVVPEEVDKISMNLKAPIVINSRNKKGAQIILDTDKYTVRHYIVDELRRQGAGKSAGADKEEGTDDSNK